jgi:hypothetical protein
MDRIEPLVQVEPPFTESICGHIDVLAENNFLDVTTITNLSTGIEHQAPVLRRFKEGRDGRLIFTREWIEVKYCPLCGKLIERPGKEALGDE